MEDNSVCLGEKPNLVIDLLTHQRHPAVVVVVMRVLEGRPNPGCTRKHTKQDDSFGDVSGKLSSSGGGCRRWLVVAVVVLWGMDGRRWGMVSGVCTWVCWRRWQKSAAVVVVGGGGDVDCGDVRGDIE